MTTVLPKKHIDVIVKYFYPVAAGIETNIIETYSVLVQQGWDVTIHTSKDILTQKNCLPDQETIRGLVVKRYTFRWWGYSPIIDYSTTDVVALHNSNISPHFFIMAYVWYLKIVHKKKPALFLTPHGGFNPEWSVFPWYQALVKKLIQYTLGVVLINHAVDGMRAVSEWERHEIIKKGVSAHKVITIDNGLEQEAYADLETEASPEIKKTVQELGDYIIQVGRIYSIKNNETTLRALTKIPDHIKFVLVGPVGSEKYLLELKKLADQLGVSHRVVFLGVIRGIDKYYIIKHAQMMVHMALWESFCNVVHEGLSQGLVCIVANNTALPLLIQDGVTGYCIETKDWNAVAQKINDVYEHRNTDRIKNIKIRSREYGLRNSWAEVAGRMNDFYSNYIVVSYNLKQQNTITQVTHTKPSLTIGIAAYNEAANIKLLLEDIVAQDIPSAELEEITVVSDASTDATDSLVESMAEKTIKKTGPIIRLLRHEYRQGANTAQNTLLKSTKSDILVILDADIKLESTKTVYELIAPLVEEIKQKVERNKKNIGIVSATIRPLPAKTFFENIIYSSHSFKLRMYENINAGNNIYTCFGPARAFSKSFYSKLHYPDNCPVDSYSYLYCRQLGYNVVYRPNACVLFRSPTTLVDHKKQSLRYCSGKRSLEDIFGADRVKKEFRIPFSIYLYASCKKLLTHPVMFIWYLSISSYIIFFKNVKKYSSQWETVVTSKNLA